MDVEARLRRSADALRQTSADAPAEGLADLQRRRTGHRRRRVAAVGAAAALVMIAAVLAVALPGGHHTPGAPGRGAAAAGPRELRAHLARVALPAGSPAEQHVAEVEQDFTFALLHQLATSKPGANLVVSPSSISTALAMLELGAAGATETQIATALQSTALSPQEQAAGWNALTADLATAAASDKIELSTTNETWLQETLHVHQGYLDSLARNFGAGLHQADFMHQPEAARRAINADVAKATHDKIQDLLPKGVVTNLTRLVLTNAVYFNAKWLAPFDPKDTADGPFHAATGDVSLPFMNNDELRAKAFSSPDLNAVELPYTGGRFTALVVEPRTRSLDDLLAGLDRTGLDALLARMNTTSVALAMPRFEVKEPITLNDALKAMGMEVPFTDHADFSPITGDRTLYVSSVEHQAYLKVTEEGTEAAAATGVVAGLTSAIVPQLRITIDRPFLFLVRDTQTGAVLFASAVNHP